MAQACIADTTTIDLSLDGIGTLRGDVRIDPHGNNPLEVTTAGLVKRGSVVRYGFAADNTTTSDLYQTPVAIAPASGYVEYGPRLTAQYAAPYPGSRIVIAANWEVQATYPGTANNPFSGISFKLQFSSNGTTWVDGAVAAQASASGQTWRWHVMTHWPIIPSSTATANFFARMVAAAGNFGSGENITCQLTQRRFMDVMY